MLFIYYTVWYFFIVAGIWNFGENGFVLWVGVEIIVDGFVLGGVVLCVGENIILDVGSVSVLRLIGVRVWGLSSVRSREFAHPQTSLGVAHDEVLENWRARYCPPYEVL